MMQTLNRLERNVAAEIEHQTGLLELLDRELEVLSSGGTHRLGEIHGALEQRVRKSMRREDERRQLVAQLGRELGLGGRELTLTRLAAETGKSELAERGQELRAVLEQVRQTHLRTTLLVRHSLQFFQDLVGALGGDRGSGVPTYDASGQSVTDRGRALAAEG